MRAGTPVSGPGGAPETGVNAGEGRRGSAAPGRPLRRLLFLLLAAALLPGPLAAQYSIEAPSGRTLAFDSASVRDMLQRTRRLRSILEEDPAVIYYVGAGDPVSAGAAAAAYPWNAVTVRSDSAVRVETPGNYREAGRAYQNYAVVRMEWIRSGGPTASCAASVEGEVERVSAFVDGWIVSRVLYGGPAFPPVDAFAFARDAGHLPALVVELGDTTLSERCRSRWRERHADAVAAYRAWRRRAFEGGGEEGTDGPAAGERSLQVNR